MTMYLNLQIGKFTVELGKNKMPKRPPRPRRVPVTFMNTDGKIVDQEFVIDDESKLRYRNLD